MTLAFNVRAAASLLLGEWESHRSMGLDCDQERIPPNIIFSFLTMLGAEEETATQKLKWHSTKVGET